MKYLKAQKILTYENSKKLKTKKVKNDMFLTFFVYICICKTIIKSLTKIFEILIYIPYICVIIKNKKVMEKANVKKWFTIGLVVLAIGMLVKYAFKVYKKEDTLK